MLKHLSLLKHVKDFFRSDNRVIEAQNKLLGFDLAYISKLESEKVTDEREVPQNPLSGLEKNELTIAQN